MKAGVCGAGERGAEKEGDARGEGGIVAVEALDGVRRSRGRVGFEYACGGRHGI